MRIGKEYLITPDMSQEYITHMAIRAEYELVKEIIARMEHGKRYIVQMEDMPSTMRECAFVAGLRVNIEECRTERVVLPTLEEVCLKPAPTLRQRLKNCAAYLREGLKR